MRLRTDRPVGRCPMPRVRDQKSWCIIAPHRGIEMTYEGKPAASFGFRHIKYEKRDLRAIVTFNRPDVLNAVNGEMLVELNTAFQDASWDDQVRVLILTGAGDRAFCTGADVKE